MQNRQPHTRKLLGKHRISLCEGELLRCAVLATSLYPHTISVTAFHAAFEVNPSCFSSRIDGQAPGGCRTDVATLVAYSNGDAPCGCTSSRSTTYSAFA